LRYLFERCIDRKWISENPARILRFPKTESQKTKEDIKYLSPDQFNAVMAACDAMETVRDGNKQRIKALILTMRWTGLWISDAVVLNARAVTGDVLRIITKKTTAPVQMPLHPDLMAALGALPLHQGGYYFWNRRTERSKASTVQGHYGAQIAAAFKRASVAFNEHHISHALRNTFAVDLLEKGVPLETVSLLLGHTSIRTTEKSYADFSKGYMNKVGNRRTGDAALVT
jgi:integrase/recombinase XerD